MIISNLLFELRDEREKIEKIITQGGIQDFNQYRFFVGKIAGLETAIELCKNIFKGENNA